MSFFFSTARALVALAAVLCWFSGEAVAGLNSQEQALASKLVGSSGQNRPFMKLDPILCQVARARAADMADRGYFDHVNPDGKGPNYLVRKAGYRLPESWTTDSKTNYIESIAVGRSSVSSTWEDWMGSAPHKQHLLAQSSFYEGQTSYGVGYVYDPGSDYQHYWVVLTAPPQPDPVLTVISPANGVRLENSTVAISGKTGAEANASVVLFRVENAGGAGGYQPVAGILNWSGTAAGLAPGLNTIRIRAIGASGNVLSETTRSVTYVMLRPLEVLVNGDGAITPGFLGSSSRQVGARYTIAASPARGMLFQGWSGAVSSTSRVLTFAMSEGMNLQANFVPNPFQAFSGGFTALVEGAAPGLARLSLSSSGFVTGTIRFEGRSYSIRTQLLADGTGTMTIPRCGLPPLSASLAFDLETRATISAQVSDGTTTSEMQLSANYRASTGAFAGAGRYNLALLGEGSEEAGLDGNGWAMIYVDPLGRARVSGALASGVAVAGSGTFDTAGSLSIYLPLYSGRGALFGTLALQGDELQGKLRWLKPAGLVGASPSPAINAELAVVSSAYLAPSAGTSPLAIAAGDVNGTLTLAGGELPGDVIQSVTIATSNQVSSPSEAPLATKMSIRSGTGFFSGTFRHPQTARITAIRGVILQKQNAGFGVFRVPTASGFVELTPVE